MIAVGDGFELRARVLRYGRSVEGVTLAPGAFLDEHLACASVPLLVCHDPDQRVGWSVDYDHTPEHLDMTFWVPGNAAHHLLGVTEFSPKVQWREWSGESVTAAVLLEVSIVPPGRQAAWPGSRVLSLEPAVQPPPVVRGDWAVWGWRPAVMEDA